MPSHSTDVRLRICPRVRTGHRTTRVGRRHWAGKGAIAMLRHVARFAPQHRILLLGTYRDGQLAPQHPLTDALGAPYRETTCVWIELQGLDARELAELFADSAVPETMQATVADAINAATSGNPFFARGVLQHLEEEREHSERKGPAVDRIV